MKPHPETFPWFMGTWIILGIASFCFFFLGKDVKRKRKWMPVAAIGTGILFMGFVVAITGQPKVVLFMAPFVALISFINIRNTRFCGSCGRTIYNHMWFSRISFCAKCGAKLDEAT